MEKEYFDVKFAELQELIAYNNLELKEYIKKQNSLDIFKIFDEDKHKESRYPRLKTVRVNLNESDYQMIVRRIQSKMTFNTFCVNAMLTMVRQLE